jgi:hypothetical protein
MIYIYKCIKSYLSLKNFFISLAWLIPIIISILALCDSRQALKNSEMETLLLQVANYVPGIPQPFPDYTVNLHSVVASKGTPVPETSRGAIIRVYVDNYWSCLISNIGNRTLSIVAFEVWRDGVHDLEHSGFFELPDEPIDLPISVAPGESKRLLLRTAIKLNDNAIDVLYFKDQLNYNLMSNDLFCILWVGAGIDQYGNPVRLNRFGEGYARFEIDTKHARQEQFELKVKTGKGKCFTDKFSFYKLPQF